MRVTLVHNPTAGNGRPSDVELTQSLIKAGHSVLCLSSKEPGLDQALAAANDLVVVAGGDGTVAKVAARINRACLVAILPTGNANNIAKSLGAYGALDDLISHWAAGVIRPFHLISAKGPWGSRSLIEGLGFGAITSALERMQGGNHSPSAAREVIREVLEAITPQYCEIHTDTANRTGRFLLVEATTIPLVGPNLLMTKTANPSDRELAICILEEGRDYRQRFSHWLTAEKSDNAPAPQTILSGRRITIRGGFQKVRLDDDFRWDENVCEREISLQREATPVHFLVPAS